MLASEFPQFEALIRRLERLFGKAIDDDTLQAYWSALRELPLAVVQRRIDEHVKRQKFFPKPAELRPKDEKPEKSAESERSFHAAVERNVRNWNERLRADPLRTKWQLLEAYVARVDVQEDPSSIAFAERMAFARDACIRLIDEGGLAFAGSDPRFTATVSRLLGGKLMQEAIAAYKQTQTVQAA